MNYKEEIKLLELQLKDLKAKQERLEETCRSHEWREPVFAPEEYNDSVIERYIGTGDDLYPTYKDVIASRDRWMRECMRCGKEEFTYNQKPIKYAPEFK